MPKQCSWTNPIFIISDKMVLAGPARLPAAPEPGLFGGFSTTVIELHQLDTRYVDVIVQIYVNLTSNRELKRNWETYTWEERKAAQ